MTVSLSIDLRGFDDVLNQFDAAPRQIERAQRRAVRKVSRQTANKAASRVAAAHAVKVRGYKQFRVKSGFNPRRRSGLVWVGHSAVKAAYARGGLRNLPGFRGARAGRYFFKGGFVATMDSGHRGFIK